MDILKFFKNLFGKKEEEISELLGGTVNERAAKTPSKRHKKHKSAKRTTHPSNPKKGGNDTQLAYAAIIDVVGEEELEEAKIQRDRMGGSRHLFAVLAERKKISYIEIAELLEKAFKPHIENLIVVKDHKKLDLDENGKVWDRRDGESERLEITPVATPQRRLRGTIQAILPYDEYVTIKRQIKNIEKRTSTNNEEDQDEEISQLKFSFKEVAEYAIKKNASDIHISFSDDYYYISLRRDGDFISEPDFMLSDKQGGAFLRQIKLEASKSTKGKFNADDNNYPQDARIVFKDLATDLRLAFIPEGTLSGKNAVVARILLKHKIDKDSFSFASMGYNKPFRDQLDEVKRLKGGLVFVTGITGSGKSTLLSHFVATFSERKRVFTIEDPIEYEIPGANVTQLQIYQPKDSSKAVGFLDYIKILKRSDPDVVFLGEMRNDETLVNAIIEASKAGQLVLSTTHISSTFDIYGALETVFKMSSSDTISLLLFSVNQVLIKKLCSECKVEDTQGKNLAVLKALYDGEKTRYAYTDPLRDFIANPPKMNIANKKGCPHCLSKGIDPGFVGRVPVYEWFRPTVSFREWYLEDGGKNAIQIERKVCSENIGVNKLQTYLELLSQGLVDADEDVIDEIK